MFYDIRKIWAIGNKPIPIKLEKKNSGKKKASKANEKPNK